METKEGETFEPSDSDVKAFAMSLDNQPLLDASNASNNNKRPIAKMFSRRDLYCCGVVLLPFSIIIIIVAIINLVEMDKYDYVPGIRWNVSIIIISIIFLILSCISYRLYYVRRINHGCMNRIVFIDAIFILLAVIAVYYWYRYDPAPKVDDECFDADSVVYIKNNMTSNEINKILLRDLQIADYVLTVDPNNVTNIFWKEVLVRVHYEWYDNKNDLYSMRKLYLENNITSITMSNDHFIFINNWNKVNKPKLIKAECVEIGDELYYYDYNEESNLLLKVVDIEENVFKQKRVYFTMSQYVLVNNIIASPFIGPHPIYHLILHKLFVSNIILIKYIWPTFMSSIFSLIAVILINISYFIFVHCFEISVFIVTIFLYTNILKWYYVSTQKKK